MFVIVQINDNGFVLAKANAIIYANEDRLISALRDFKPDIGQRYTFVEIKRNLPLKVTPVAVLHKLKLGMGIDTALITLRDDLFTNFVKNGLLPDQQIISKGVSKTVDLGKPGILNDAQIAFLCQGEKPMIENFVDHQVKTRKVPESNIPLVKAHMEDYEVCEDERIVSYGLSSFGYDFRVDRKFKLFTNLNASVIDPLNFSEDNYVEREGDSIIIPPNSFVLASTVERFNMPDDVVAICVGKSTLARVGCSPIITPLEPGWSGYLTLEYANHTSLPMILRAGQGGGQLMFFRGMRPDVTYGDRGGKYMDQPAGPVNARV